MPGKFFEDVSVGDTFTSLRRTVTETDIVNFVTLAGIFEDLFLDTEYVEKETPFHGRIAPGSLTFAIAEGLFTLLQIFQGTSLGFLGLEEMRLPAPVYCGDTIQVEIEILEKRETRNPDRGVIVAKHLVKNQRGDVVMHFKVARLIRRKGH